MVILIVRRWRPRVIPKKNDWHEPPVAQAIDPHAVDRFGTSAMKPHHLCALASLAAALAFAVPAAHASEAQDASAGAKLVKQHGCFTCHAMQGTKIGPGFADIAAKFAAQGEDKAEKVLETDVHDGVKGTAMPANASFSKAELDQIVDWILSLKK